ncbi:hypothetical protein HY501_00025 [Candidatus Woesearchaeota archaeon]|nr:hypothetical protein [Candidatus Woesearchaeota archaeon]
MRSLKGGIILILLFVFAGVLAAPWGKNWTGSLIFDRLFGEKAFSNQRIQSDCPVSIDGACYDGKKSLSDAWKQEGAGIVRFNAGQKRAVQGEMVSISPVPGRVTKDVMVYGRTFKSETPVISLCIADECREYGAGETLAIDGTKYSLALTLTDYALIPHDLPIGPHDEFGRGIEPADDGIFRAPEGLAAMPHQFKVGFVVDRGDYPSVTEEDLLDALGIANEKLSLSGTPVRLEFHSLVDLDPAYEKPFEIATMGSTIIEDYFLSHSADPPHGVVILRSDPSSEDFGGYQAISTNLAKFGFRNNFYSPLYGDSFIYGSVIDYDQAYGTCGYDNNGNHISNESVTRPDGSVECFGQLGTPCVYYSGAWRCSTIDFASDEYVQEYGFFANMIIHEFLHAFHPSADAPTYFHYCGNECPLLELSQSGLSCSRFHSQHYSGICPEVWEVFKRGWNLCPDQPQWGNTLGRPCRQNCDCNEGEQCSISPEGKFCENSQCNPYWNDCGAGTCRDDGSCLYFATAVPLQESPAKKAVPFIFFRDVEPKPRKMFWKTMAS